MHGVPTKILFILSMLVNILLNLAQRDYCAARNFVVKLSNTITPKLLPLRQ